MGLGVRVRGVGFRLQDFRVQGSSFRGLGFGVKGFHVRFRVQGSRFRIRLSRCPVMPRLLFRVRIPCKAHCGKGLGSFAYRRLLGSR